MASFTNSRSNRATFANYDHQLSDEFQTQVETHEGGTQVLDDHVNALSNELVNNDGDTEVLEDSQELFHTKWAKWGSLEGKQQVSNEHKNNAGTKLVDVEGDTQIPDESDDMFQNLLLCTEDLDALSNGRIAVTNSEGNSSREMDHRKTSGDDILQGTSYLNHSSGASLTLSADKDDNTSGYVPLRFTEIRVESLIASGLAARNRAQSGNIIGAFSSENTSRTQQEIIDKNDEVSVRVSPFSIERTDDDDYVFVREPKDPEFRNGRKVKSSAVRKLFAEEVVSQTESYGIKLSDDTKFEEEPAEGGDSDEAELSYLNSQEPNELAHAKALDFVEKFLKTNLVDIDKYDHGSSHGKSTNAIAHGKCIKHLVKKNVQRSSVGVAKAFDWDDNNEDEGGGAFFCKMKEELLKKESLLRNSLPPIRKSSLLDSEQLENIREGPKINVKKRKLSYSDTRFVSHNKKKIVSAFETKAGRNYSNGWNWQPNAGKVSLRKNTPDMPVFGTDASADTSSAVEAMEPNLYLNNNKVSSIKKSTREGFPEGWTKKSSVFNQHNLRTRARPHPYVDKVLGKSAHSIKISDGHEEGLDKDGSVRITVVDDKSCANFIAQRTRKALLSKNLKSDDFIVPVEQLMEDSASAGRKTRSGNGHTTKNVTKEVYSSRIDRGHIGEFELIKSMNSKTKASDRSVRDQSNRMASHKEAKPRRSCRLSKFANFDNSVIHPVNEGSNGCTFGQDGLKIDVEAEAVVHTEASLDTRLDLETSEYTFKVSGEDSFKRLCRNIPFLKEKIFRKRACTIPEMPSAISPDSPQSTEMTNGMNESSKLTDPEKRHENDNNGSCRTVRNQGKQSETMTCTPVAQRTRKALLSKNLKSAETFSDDFIISVEQPMEDSASAGRKTRSGNSHTPKSVTNEVYSSRIDRGHIGEFELIKSTNSKTKASDRSVGAQSNRMASHKEARPRRSCRLSKFANFDDSVIHPVNEGSNGCTFGQDGLKSDVEAVVHTEASLDVRLDFEISEYAFKVSGENSFKRLCSNSTFPKKKNFRKRACIIPEMPSGISPDSPQSIEMTNGMNESSKIIDPERRHENDDNGSCRAVKNQGKQSETMTCTPVAQRTRRASSLRNNSNSAETIRDDYVKLIQKHAEILPAKRSITTSLIGFDPVQLNSKDRSFKVNSDLVCEVQLVELSEAQQCPPKSSDKVLGEPVNVSSLGGGSKLRRSRQLNRSSALNDPSIQSVNKHTTAVATGKQQIQNDYGIAMEETVPKLEASPRELAKVSGLECVKPTDSKSYEEASPIFIGNDYYKTSSKPKPSRPENKKEDDNLITCPPNMMPYLKGSQKRRDMTDVRVLFSRFLDEETLKQQKQILDRLGASTASSVSDATHFIANKFVRTRNMLEAIALGKPVVTPLWLVNCCEEKFLIDEKSYILRDESNEKEIGFSMPVSLVAFQQSLLQNRRVFVTPNTKPGREVITCLVKAVRGQVIGRICRSALRGDNGFNDLLILSCEDDFSICQPFLEKGAPVYSSELLLQGIVTQRLEYERYRLFGDYIKRTR